MPIQGLVRLRKWQFGKQSAHGTAVTPTRAVAFSGVLDVNPNWTQQTDVDVGSIDPVLADYRLGTDITASLTGQLSYDDIPLIMSAGVVGGQTAVTSSSTYQWTHQAVSLTATALDEFTTEWGDDAKSDGYKARDGILESIELGFDETLGPWTFTGSWRYGYVDGGVTPTAGLQVGSNLPLVMGAHTALYIDDTSGGIGNTLITDALHRASITITNSIDQKRFAAGSNSAFAIAGYALTSREITASFTFAKTAQTVGLASEAAKWLSADPTNRYLNVKAISPSIIAGVIPYSWDLRLSGNWITRTDEAVGGNSVVTLVCRGRYDAGLGYALRSYVVNNRPTLA
jgi:hypothetical protein